MTGCASFLRISVVTPSYNQAPFLGACMRSVLGQRYPNLEYIVVDGGSTDGSVDIITSFEKDVAYWVSEPDAGHYDALNKGFQRATGDILAWLNADDMYVPWAFQVVASIFETLPAVAWLSTLYPLFWDETGAPRDCTRYPSFDRRRILRQGLGVQQASTFWRRSLWEQSGARLDTTFALAADLDLWGRFWKHAVLYGVPVPLGGMRVHQAQRHLVHRPQYVAEAASIFEHYARRADGRTARAFIAMHSVLPRRLRRALTRFGLPYHYENCAKFVTEWKGSWTAPRAGRAS